MGCCGIYRVVRRATIRTTAHHRRESGADSPVLQSRAGRWRLDHISHHSSEDGRVDTTATFIKRFGDLVTLLRVDPGNDAAQDLALSAAAAAVWEAAVEVEAGVEWSQIPDDMGLKARMLARQVDRLRIEAGTDPIELQSLARALAHDLTPIPTTPGITVELVRLLPPPSPGGDAPGHGTGQPDGASAVNRRLGRERRQGEDRRRRFRGHWNGTERRRHHQRQDEGVLNGTRFAEHSDSRKRRL